MKGTFILLHIIFQLGEILWETVIKKGAFINFVGLALIYIKKNGSVL